MDKTKYLFGIISWDGGQLTLVPEHVSDTNPVKRIELTGRDCNLDDASVTADIFSEVHECAMVDLRPIGSAVQHLHLPLNKQAYPTHPGTINHEAYLKWFKDHGATVVHAMLMLVLVFSMIVTPVPAKAQGTQYQTFVPAFYTTTWERDFEYEIWSTDNIAYASESGGRLALVYHCGDTVILEADKDFMFQVRYDPALYVRGAYTSLMQVHLSGTTSIDNVYSIANIQTGIILISTKYQIIEEELIDMGQVDFIWLQ